MRRLIAVPVLAGLLLTAACSSTSGTKRTVTVVNTVTGKSTGATGTAAGTGSSIVIGSSGAKPSGTAATSPATPGSAATGSVPVSGSGATSGGASGSGTASTTKTTPATSTSAAPFKKVDPTTADCSALITAGSVKSALGITIPDSSTRVRIGAASNGATKAIRCLYGSKDGGKTAPVRVRLTQYNSTANAKKQLDIDIQTAKDLTAGPGGGVSTITVGGYPASLQIVAGGAVEMQYDTWTMVVAVSDKLVGNAKLTAGMPQLATQVLARVLKG